MLVISAAQRSGVRTNSAARRCWPEAMATRMRPVGEGGSGVASPSSTEIRQPGKYAIGSSSVQSLVACTVAVRLIGPRLTTQRAGAALDRDRAAVPGRTLGHPARLERLERPGDRSARRLRDQAV